jgi:hypothetical protein
MDNNNRNRMDKKGNELAELAERKLNLRRKISREQDKVKEAERRITDLTVELNNLNPDFSGRYFKTNNFERDTFLFFESNEVVVRVIPMDNKSYSSVQIFREPAESYHTKLNMTEITKKEWDDAIVFTADTLARFFEMPEVNNGDYFQLPDSIH